MTRRARRDDRRRPPRVAWSIPTEPGTGEVLGSGVRAAGLNGADRLQVAGLYPPRPAFSRHPGLELAGEVLALGPGEVTASPSVTADGRRRRWQAQRAVVNERHSAADPRRHRLGRGQASPRSSPPPTTPCSPRRTSRSASGSACTAPQAAVGTAGVQLAVAAGASVVATVRNPERRADVAALGATVVDPDDFGTHGPFDVVLELVGAPNLPADVAALATGGRIAVIGVGAGAKAEVNLLALMGARGSICGSTLRARSLEDKADAARRVERHVLGLLADRTVQVPIAATYAMTDAAAAYERFAAGNKFGKIILEDPT
ncbi:MAG: zinc-binding dehydrogenase [Acidimicrobiales bacterium]